MDLSAFIQGILVLMVGGILGAIGTYLIKPILDAWLDRRKQAREAREAVRRHEEEAARHRRQADHYAVDYRDKLVRELRNLRILEMVRPLDLERTYVRIKIREEQPLRFVDDQEMAALSQTDPNLPFEIAPEKLAEERAASLSPEEALRSYRHLAVLGDPGAGKTTMLKYLCLLSAQGKLRDLPSFPVFVPLNRYARAPQVRILEFIVSDLSQRYGFPGVSGYLDQRLENGSTMLLLDGLDEVTISSPQEAEAVYHRTASEINRLAARYPKCPIVVTSRRAGWRGLLTSSFLTMEVLDFGWDQIQHFIGNWFGKRSDRARRLQSILSQQVRMQALAANPLLLSLIAIVFDRDLELPERRAKLYERCVQVLLTEWDAHRGIKRASRFTTDRKRDLLEDIALHFHCQGLRFFRKDNLLHVIATYLPTVNIPAGQATLVLEEISAQNGLLKEQAADWYGFLHLTLQEYFVAVSLDKANRLEPALERLHNPWWEEVILLLAGMLKDATPLLNAILSGREDIFHNNLLLAGRCLAGTPRITRAGLRKQIISDLKSLIGNPDQHWLPRIRAVRTLIEADPENSLEYLLNLLGNQDIHWQVRAVAADTLRSAESKTVISGLLDLLSDDQNDRRVRERAADTLVALMDPSITPHLLALISNREIDPQIRAQICRNLGHLGDKTIVPALIELLWDPSLDNHVAWSLGRTLGNLNFTNDPQVLLRFLKSKRVNIIARWALAKAVDNLEPAAAPTVVGWISDESIDTSVRWSFAFRFGRLGWSSTRERLRELFSDEALDPALRASIGISLLELGETKVVTQLKIFLGDATANYYSRRKVAEALVRFGERGIAEQLLAFLKEEDLPKYSGQTIAKLLAGYGDSEVAHQLLNLLRDEKMDTAIRVGIADALQTLDLSGLTSQIKTLVADERVEPSVRGRVAQCLAQDPKGVTWLIELLERKDISEQVYSAIDRASRQSGVRVFTGPNGGYQVLPLQA